MKKVRIGKEQAIQRIRHYCAYQERAQQEVRDKLYELGMTMDEVEEIMSDLIAENFLNEERFADTICRRDILELRDGERSKFNTLYNKKGSAAIILK